MATIRLTVLNSIKESNGKLPILICISQKKDRAYIKTEFLLDDISEFEDGRVVYRKDAGIMAQFENLGELVKNTIFVA